MKKSYFIFLIVLAVSTVFFVVDNIKTSDPVKENTKIGHQVKDLKKLIAFDSRYNKRIVFLIDMKIRSGKNRFFVYDLEKNKIIDKGLVAHGSGSETGIKGKLRFSNVPNSLSTSLGRYSIGKCYYGKFGKAYKLNGLDISNDNAYKRDIVFHYYYDVPYKEKDGYICNSYGCPMVNKKYFERIAKLIDASQSNILMSIYY